MQRSLREIQAGMTKISSRDRGSHLVDTLINFHKQREF